MYYHSKSFEWNKMPQNSVFCKQSSNNGIGMPHVFQKYLTEFLNAGSAYPLSHNKILSDP